MPSHKQCPTYQNLKTRTASGQFASSGDQAFKNRTCDACGTTWRPACPRWLAITIIVAGIVLPLGLLALNLAGSQGISELGNTMGRPAQTQPRNGWGMPAVCGFVMAACGLYGIRVLYGKAGQMRILVNPTDKDEERGK